MGSKIVSPGARGEVARAVGGRGHHSGLGERLALAQTLVGEQPEQAVFLQRPAHRCAELIPLEQRDRSVAAIKVVLGVELGIPQELEHRAVKRVGAGLGGDVDLRDRATVLGLEDPRLHLELLERVKRRQHQVGVEVRVRILDAVQCVVVIVDALAGDIEGELVAGAAHALLALGRRRTVGGGTGNQRRQLEIGAAVQRQFHDSLVLYHLPDLGGFRLDQRRAAGHLDGFGHIAHLDGEVEPSRHADLDFHPGADLLRKPLGVHCDFIDARRQRRQIVDAFLVGAGGSSQVGGLVDGGDPRRRNHGPRGIGDSAGDLARRVLGEC